MITNGKEPGTPGVKGSINDKTNITQISEVSKNSTANLPVLQEINDEFLKAQETTKNENAPGATKSDFDLEYAIEKCRINSTDQIMPPEPALEFYNKTKGTWDIIGTMENFSVIIGKAKSRKSFLIGMMLAAAVNESESQSQLRCSLKSSKREIIYFDTEQSKYHVHLAIKRICKQTGISSPTNLHVYSLRSLNPSERLKLIREVIYLRHSNIGLVVIDGIRDLVTSINNEEQATDISSKLMKWTEELKIHLITVLHTNKTDSNARGHLGTELINKAETTLSVSIATDDKGISIVEPEYCRNPGPESFAFKIDDSEFGIPKIIEDYQMKDNSSGVKKNTFYDYPDNRNYELLNYIYSKGTSEFIYHDLLEELKVGHKTFFNQEIGTSKAKTYFTFLKTKGWLEQSKNKGPWKLKPYKKNENANS